ncbi:hypothetical protein F9K33_00225 [bacterium]|nr:MAG: hypothetical protein F9K33_00225 [bacterium]
MIGSCKKGDNPNRTTHRVAYKIVVPDSLIRIKNDLKKFYERWNARQDLPFTFSDSAEHVLRINDSAEYHNTYFQLIHDTIKYKDERLPLQSTLIAVKANGHIQIVTHSSVRMWFLLEALFELFENYADRPEAVLIHSGRQIVLKSYKTDSGWIDDLNVFATRRQYERQAAMEETFFSFSGGKMPYDSTKMNAALSHYPSRFVKKFRPAIFVYPDYETKSQIFSNVMEHSYDLAKNQIHIVDCSLTRLRFTEIVSVYFASQIYGSAMPRLTEGLGIFYANTYFGKPFSWWNSKRPLLNLIDKTNLLSKPAENENAFLYTYLAVLFWSENRKSIELVFKSPDAYIQNFSLDVTADKIFDRKIDSIPYFKGFSYAHSNGVTTGYMSKQSKESLKALREIGTDAVSITPFGYAKNENESSVYFVLDNTWDETLASLFKANEDAQALGMHVMMKPHIWLGNGKWCGEIRIADERELKKWENAYCQFITYHGLIAELAGMQSLCVAVELPHMFHHTDMWRRIIRCARVAFSGPLTYGANWMDEYEGIVFWDDLDFIGIQSYFPLSKSKSESASGIRAHAKALSSILSQFSNKWNRPIVFTEAGFPSIEYGLMNPHQEDFSQNKSEETQSMGYSVLFEEFSRQPWFKGFYWWKWESGNSSRRRSDKSFHIRGKKTEQIVKQYYLNRVGAKK